MRRVLATLLVSVFSFSLIGPALVAGGNSDLPACCRRGGQHHCAMMDMDSAPAPSSGPAVKANTPKCPYFPKGGALLPHSGAALLAASQSVSLASPGRLAIHSRAEAGYHLSSSRSHQKRGPPSLLL